MRSKALDYLNNILKKTDIVEKLCIKNESEIQNKNNDEINYEKISKIIRNTHRREEDMEKYFLLEGDYEISKNTFVFDGNDIRIKIIKGEDKTNAREYFINIINENIIELDGKEKEVIKLSNLLKGKIIIKSNEIFEKVNDNSENTIIKKEKNTKINTFIKKIRDKKNKGYKKKTVNSSIEIPK